MSQLSIPLDPSKFASAIAEQQTSASTVQVRRGLPVIAGTDQNQVKPIATGSSSMLTTILGIAQSDGNNGEVVQIALPGQIAVARINGTGNRGDYLIAANGSTTDAENGSLEVQSTIANNDLIVGRLLEDATDQSYVKIAVMMDRKTAS